MTWAWLQRSSGVSRLAERVDLLERQLAEAQHVAEQTADRIAATERLIVEATTTMATMHGELRALRREARSAARLLDRALASGVSADALAEERRTEIARMDAAIAFIERRIEDEAEQTRRGMAGLFDQLGYRRAAPATEAV